MLGLRVQRTQRIKEYRNDSATSRLHSQPAESSELFSTLRSPLGVPRLQTVALHARLGHDPCRVHNVIKISYCSELKQSAVCQAMSRVSESPQKGRL